MPFVELKTRRMRPGFRPSGFTIGVAAAGPWWFLHGGWGYGVYPIDRQIEALQDQVRFIIPDRSGHGRSTRFAGPLPLEASDFDIHPTPCIRGRWPAAQTSAAMNASCGHALYVDRYYRLAVSSGPLRAASSRRSSRGTRTPVCSESSDWYRAPNHRGLSRDEIWAEVFMLPKDLRAMSSSLE